MTDIKGVTLYDALNYIEDRIKEARREATDREFNGEPIGELEVGGDITGIEADMYSYCLRAESKIDEVIRLIKEKEKDV